MQNELYHYGVLGMRWGIRRNRKSSLSTFNTTKNGRPPKKGTLQYYEDAAGSALIDSYALRKSKSQIKKNIRGNILRATVISVSKPSKVGKDAINRIIRENDTYRKTIRNINKSLRSNANDYKKILEGIRDKQSGRRMKSDNDYGMSKYKAGREEWEYFNKRGEPESWKWYDGADYYRRNKKYFRSH